jgi:hypothetical protein
MVVKYFSEKVNPGLHDGAARKEAFGIWKEGFLHHRFEKHEEFLKQEAEKREAREREERGKELRVHAKTRKDMLIKYFSESISPKIHDAAAVKEGFGVWKEGFMHERFAEREERMRETIGEREAEAGRKHRELMEEHKVHAQARSDMVIKLFSEKVSPAIHDMAVRKEGFDVWKEQFMYVRFELQEKLYKLQALAAERRAHEEKIKEQKVHRQTRSDMMIKYFSERVAPGVHDAAMRKEGFGVWREGFMHERFEEREGFLKQEAEETYARSHAEQLQERRLHGKTRGDMIVK